MGSSKSLPASILFGALPGGVGPQLESELLKKWLEQVQGSSHSPAAALHLYYSVCVCVWYGYGWSVCLVECSQLGRELTKHSQWVELVLVNPRLHELSSAKSFLLPLRHRLAEAQGLVQGEHARSEHCRLTMVEF